MGAQDSLALTQILIKRSFKVSNQNVEINYLSDLQYIPVRMVKLSQQRSIHDTT